ncbi:hypothetical protein NFI96_008189 [Prochilodus magdalenae]|nr:hypothetical protein NFI96_008189 [Prochilodus magdalenae]
MTHTSPRPTVPPKDVSRQNSESDELWDELSQEEESFYGASPPRTPRQMKRMSGKHQRGSQSRAAGRSPIKGWAGVGAGDWAGVGAGDWAGVGAGDWAGVGAGGWAGVGTGDGAGVGWRLGAPPPVKTHAGKNTSRCPLEQWAGVGAGGWAGVPVEVEIGQAWAGDWAGVG